MQMTDWEDATPDEIVEQVNAMTGMSFADLAALDWPHRVAFDEAGDVTQGMFRAFTSPYINAAFNPPRAEPSYGGFTDDIVQIGPAVVSERRLHVVNEPRAGNRRERRAAAARAR